MREELGQRLALNWRYFSLEQANNKEGPEWKLWEQPEEYASRGRNAFRAADAARNQGEAAFDAFHHALLKAKHEDGHDIADAAVLTDVARSVSLDMAAFGRDLADRKPMVRLREDHTYAVETLSIFGTPTLVFPEEQAVFLALSPTPSAEEALDVFEDVRRIAQDRRPIRELKRPVRVENR